MASSNVAGAARLRGEARAAAGSAPNNYRFTGRTWDGENGMQYSRARYLATQVGRFSTIDPQLFPSAATDVSFSDAYVYVRNRPSFYTDPSGEECVEFQEPDGSPHWVCHPDMRHIAETAEKFGLSTLEVLDDFGAWGRLGGVAGFALGWCSGLLTVHDNLTTAHNIWDYQGYCLDEKCGNLKFDRIDAYKDCYCSCFRAKGVISPMIQECDD
jgi:RHS repeat-associated protein